MRKAVVSRNVKLQLVMIAEFDYIFVNAVADAKKKYHFREAPDVRDIRKWSRFVPEAFLDAV